MQEQSGTVDTKIAGEVLAKLKALLAKPEPDEEFEGARAWADAISKATEFLHRKDHPVAFIGEVGVGKSSLVAVAARLLRSDQAPTDRNSLKSQSLLAIGAGRTTVCEVRVRSETKSTSSSGIALEVEPIEQQELDKLIDLWSEDEWRRRRGQSKTIDEAPPTPQEVARALRSMAGYSERIQSYRHGNLIRRRAITPLDNVVPNFDSPTALGHHLREKMQLDLRTQTRWDWRDDSEEALQSLKELAEAVNGGNESSATLPKAMTFVLPSMMDELSAQISEDGEIELELIDTRGLDAGVGLFGRRDLQNFVSDDRAMLVLCSPFKSAPGDAIRGFLSSLKDDARWRSALDRIVLVLLDQGDADQVNGAEADRLTGQEIKVSECQRELADVGIDVDVLPLDRILAVDVLLDSREDLICALGARLRAIRLSAESDLAKALENAQILLDRRGHDQGAKLQHTVDEQIRFHLSSTIPEAPPLQDPLAGLYAAVRVTRYASIVYASCRRKGEYRNLDLYEAIKAEASRALTAWLTPSMNAALSYLEKASVDPNLREISDFVNLRTRQFSQGFVEAVTTFGNAVEHEVRQALRGDDALWQRCSNEWGLGGGFKSSVLDHMKKWASAQPFSAFSDLTPVVKAVPFWGDVAKPVMAPQFGLHVRNLRALRRVEWKPAAVSLLIGANGAGKTTTMLVLRLLKLAYERGLAEAVRLALGGAQNLSHWYRKDDEPIEVGVSLGTVRWRIALNIAEGVIDPVAEEQLTDGDQIVFSRDSLGVLRHHGQVMSSDAGPTALRFLIDRGAVDASIRSVANFLQKVNVFQEPDLVALRRGSPAEDDKVLELRGVNAVTVLRRWNQAKLMKYRFDFVVGGLQEAFPEQFEALDFDQAGNTLTARIYRPGSENASWLTDGANGLLQMLILLCDVAYTSAGGVVAIDEPENGLHPFALRVFLRKTRQWAAKHHVTVLLATHSTVLLDEFNATPEAVFVMATRDERDERPIPLDQLRDPDWLDGFNLGELYAQGEFGSNDDRR
jgi:predicted ATPase/GTPase SAR1 family protein